MLRFLIKMFKFTKVTLLTAITASQIRTITIKMTITLNSFTKERINQFITKHSTANKSNHKSTVT